MCENAQSVIAAPHQQAARGALVEQRARRIEQTRSRARQTTATTPRARAPPRFRTARARARLHLTGARARARAHPRASRSRAALRSKCCVPRSPRRAASREKQRIAVGQLVQRCSQRTVEAPDLVAHDLGHVLARERAQREHFAFAVQPCQDVGHARQARFDVARRADERDARPADAARQKAQQLERCHVGRVRDRRTAARAALRARTRAGTRSRLRTARSARVGIGAGALTIGARVSPSSSARTRGGGEQRERAEQLEPREVRRRAAGLPRPTPADGEATRERARGQLVAEPCLADARLTVQDAQTAATECRSSEQLLQAAQLARTPDQHAADTTTQPGGGIEEGITGRREVSDLF